MAIYNTTRSFQELLEAHESSPPSFTVRLYPDFWQLNNGSKCWYNNPMASLLDDIRAQRIPVDFLELFDSAKVPFYEGCMIVEVHDYRPPKATDQTLEEPQKTRVVLSPSPETLWADICLMNEKLGSTWTDREALDVEARVLLSTAPPLCLDPDPHLTRMVNNTLRASVPTQPLSLKRKVAVMEQEDQETEKARRAKLAQFMNPKYMRSAVSAPSYRVLEAIQRERIRKATEENNRTGQTLSTTAPVSAPGYGVPAAPTAPAPAVPSSYAPQAVPMPPAVPSVIPIPPPSATAPAQPVAAPGNAEALKRHRLGEGSQHPSQVPRASATPVQQAVQGSAIPPHLQAHHAAQMAHRTPPRASQSPHPPPNGATSAQTPPGRPPSAMQRPPSQPTHVAATPRPPTAHPAGAQAIHTQYQGQQAANVKLMAQNFMLKKNQQQAAAATNGAATGAFPQSAQPGVHPQGQPAMPYMQYYPYQNPAQQRLNQPGQNATPVNRSPMNSSQGSTPQRSSPLAGAQRLTTQSPMPANAQQTQAQAQVQAQAQAQAQVQSQAQAQAGQPAAQGNYSYAQYAAQFRPPAQGHAPQPHLVAHPLANGGAQAGAAANPQAAQQTAQQLQAAQQFMARYPQMYYQVQPGQIPAGYWQMGRGGPVANGQVQMPNIASHTQQMQLNANKAVQGGVQGS